MVAVIINFWPLNMNEISQNCHPEMMPQPSPHPHSTVIDEEFPGMKEARWTEKQNWPQIAEVLWHPTPVLLPGKSHGQRSLVGCSPWGHWESDTTEWLHFHVSLSCIGGGNGSPLQYSCLENPRDSRAWWAAIYGVAQSRKWLMWLSSSSSSFSSTEQNYWTKKSKTTVNPIQSNLCSFL